MSSMSWYRFYRPTQIRSLHLDSVRQTLEKMLITNNFPHAFLFAGPKGTGKTSSARILAAILNDPQNAAAVQALFFRTNSAKKTLSLQEPNEKDELVQRIQRGASFVVHELDAASNRGIDDVRQLRERMHLPPQEGSISVYILDEVHMLTTEAFNALLKMLEEPPAHVVFILATTELQKIPETILSRCTLVRFQRASEAELQAAMQRVLDIEKIAIDPVGLIKIATAADGSFRDAIKLLEMIAAGKKTVSIEEITAQLHQTHEEKFSELIKYIVTKEEKKVVNFFRELRVEDADPKSFYLGLLQYLHAELRSSVLGEREPRFAPQILHYILTQFALPGTDTNVPIAFLGLELRALEMIFKSKEKNGSGARTIPPTKVAQKSNVQPPEITTVPELLSTAGETVVSPQLESVLSSTPIPSSTPLPQHRAMTSVTPKTFLALSTQEVCDKWDQLLQIVRQKNSSIEAVLRSSKLIKSENGRIVIEVYYQFHQEQLRQPKFRTLLDECTQLLFGGLLEFEFALAASAKPGAVLSTISGEVNEEDHLIQLAKDLLV